jgi:hypothetical protein
MPETTETPITVESTRLMDDPTFNALYKEEVKNFLKKSAVKAGVAVAAVTAAVIVVKKIRNGEDPLEEAV